jgi:hypothetical protein
MGSVIVDWQCTDLSATAGRYRPHCHGEAFTANCITTSFGSIGSQRPLLLNSEIIQAEQSEELMSENKKKNPPPVDNTISEETGQFDLRFVLWRHFCAQNNVPVESLPSQLKDELKDKWEEMKASRLRGPTKK